MGTGPRCWWVSHHPAQGRGVRAGAAPPSLAVLLSFVEKNRQARSFGEIFQTNPGLIKKGV